MDWKLGGHSGNYTPRLRRGGEAVFDYNFLMSLNEKDYKKYLCQAYYIKTGQKLNLKHPKTLNEKIQWLKLFDNKQQKSELTDKVLVRDWVREKIGDEYLKPVLWIGDKFDDIPFSSLPFSFIVKCNHGCKWQFIIKDKDKFLNEKRLFNTIKMYTDNWLIQSFFGWSDFETQYLNINPKIIIEPLFIEFEEVEVLCFNGEAKVIQKFKYDNKRTRFYHTFDENFNSINLSFRAEEKYFETQADEILKKAVELSKTLANGFKFVRIDWMFYQNKLHFGEMTFTPYSGFIFFAENHNELQIKLGKILNLKGD